MKNTVLSILLLFPGIKSFACEVCEQNQPEILQGITHGPGPSGNFDYIVAGVAMLTVGLSFLLALKYLIKPREKQPGHIKNIVLDEN